MTDYGEIVEGIKAIWNNQFDEAEKIFEKKKDSSPRYALHYAEAMFLKSFITGDSNDTMLALNRLKAAKDMALNQLKNLESKKSGKGASTTSSPEVQQKEEIEKINQIVDARIVTGDCLMMIAVLQVTLNERLKGVFTLRKSWKVFEKGLKLGNQNKEKLDPELSKSLNFGAGVFLFAMSIIPSKFMKLVSLAGFKANRDLGLEYIKEAHKSGGIRAPFATMTLLFNNLLLPRGLSDAEAFLKEAEELIKEGLSRYPTGSLFNVMGSHCARKQCKIDEGIKFMEAALDNSKHLNKSPLIYRYELGNCYCMKLDWKKAIDLWTPLCDEEKFQVRVICSLQVATCYIMLDDDANSTKFLNKAVNMPGKKMNFDQIVIRQAKRYQVNGGHFGAFEILYLRRDLAKMIPIMDQVLAALDKKAEKIGAHVKKDIPVAASPGNKLADKLGKLSPFSKKKETDFSFDYRCCYLLLRGSVLKALKRNAEAIECFKEVIALGDSLTEKFYLPYALYELGESYFIEGKVEDAENTMKECNKISGYDWEDPLRVRLRVSMDQLKKKDTTTEKKVDLTQLDFGTVEDKEEDEQDVEDI